MKEMDVMRLMFRNRIFLEIPIKNIDHLILNDIEKDMRIIKPNLIKTFRISNNVLIQISNDDIRFQYGLISNGIVKIQLLNNGEIVNEIGVSWNETEEGCNANQKWEIIDKTMIITINSKDEDYFNLNLLRKEIEKNREINK